MGQQLKKDTENIIDILKHNDEIHPFKKLNYGNPYFHHHC